MTYTQGDLLQLAAGVYPPTGKSITFTGAAGLGAIGTINLFSVTGRVLLAMIAVCDTTLVGATATLATGVSGATARFLPQTTGTTIVSGGTVDITGVVAAGTAPKITPNQLAFNGQTIIATVATAALTAGLLTWYAYWIPLTTDGLVTAL